ncbi:hypothetical protein [Confluentibacter flavum]|uniref:Uncharacterized protein n=1 Tax=Confluentibacter flavum TaxID=1909700 RepID=A0A2N3HLR9_9FLAO|nr:hypothetical protein [Confluentibacter flavum]PKQ45910.1 hypothetical protein CSW08_05675 [Confluentibacter flavum]
MKKIFIITFILFGFNCYSQDLYIQYWDNDQKETYIKNVQISDENGTITENKFLAKSQIHLIKIFNNRGYELYKIEVAPFPNGAITKYHIWFKRLILHQIKRINRFNDFIRV